MSPARSIFWSKWRSIRSSDWWIFCVLWVRVGVVSLEVWLADWAFAGCVVCASQFFWVLKTKLGGGFMFFLIFTKIGEDESNFSWAAWHISSDGLKTRNHQHGKNPTMKQIWWFSTTCLQLGSYKLSNGIKFSPQLGGMEKSHPTRKYHRKMFVVLKPEEIKQVIVLGGGNANIFLCSFLPGEMIQVDSYFSKGLVQPPT